MGSILLVVGCLLPWITLVTIFGEVSRNGLDDGGDGVVLLVLGLISLLIGFYVGYRRAPRWASVVPVVIGALSMVVLVIDYNDVTGRIDRVERQAASSANASVGSGLWLSMIGASIVVIAGVLGAINRRAEFRAEATGTVGDGSPSSTPPAGE